MKERCQAVTVESRHGDEVVAHVVAECPMSPDTAAAVKAIIKATLLHAELLQTIEQVKPS